MRFHDPEPGPALFQTQLEATSKEGKMSTKKQGAPRRPIAYLQALVSAPWIWEPAAFLAKGKLESISEYPLVRCLKTVEYHYTIALEDDGACSLGDPSMRAIRPRVRQDGVVQLLKKRLRHRILDRSVPRDDSRKRREPGRPAATLLCWYTYYGKMGP